MLTFSIASHSNPSAEPYQVQYNGVWYCPCKGFGYRRTCSHIKAAQALYDAQLAQLSAASQSCPEAAGHCSICGAELVGTHHKLSHCPSCYRQMTLHSS